MKSRIGNGLILSGLALAVLSPAIGTMPLVIPPLLVLSFIVGFCCPLF